MGLTWDCCAEMGKLKPVLERPAFASVTYNWPSRIARHTFNQQIIWSQQAEAEVTIAELVGRPWSNWQGPHCHCNREGSKEARIPFPTSRYWSSLTKRLPVAAGRHYSPAWLNLRVRNSPVRTDSVSLCFLVPSGFLYYHISQTQFSDCNRQRGGREYLFVLLFFPVI